MIADVMMHDFVASTIVEGQPPLVSVICWFPTWVVSDRWFLCIAQQQYPNRSTGWNVCRTPTGQPQIQLEAGFDVENLLDFNVVRNGHTWKWWIALLSYSRKWSGVLIWEDRQGAFSLYRNTRFDNYIPPNPLWKFQNPCSSNLNL